jgi:hypothetical protein
MTRFPLLAAASPTATTIRRRRLDPGPSRDEIYRAGGGPK